MRSLERFDASLTLTPRPPRDMITVPRPLWDALLTAAGEASQVLADHAPENIEAQLSRTYLETCLIRARRVR